MKEIISETEWHLMLEQSKRLLLQANLAERYGEKARADKIWKELGPLNRRIRSKNLIVQHADGSRF